MLYLALKALVSGAIVMLVSEVARRSPALGALIVSLRRAIAGDFLVRPASLPLFLLLPVPLRSGLAFYPSLAICVAVTALLYFGMAAGLARFGVEL